MASWLLVFPLSGVGSNAAEDDWGFDLEIFGYLPIIELELEDGSKSKITRDDILDDLDLAALWATRVRKGRWSLTSDFIYLGISDKADLPLLPNLPDVATVRKAGFDAWIITPTLGYTVVSSDRQKLDVFAGGRYFRIKFDVTLDIDPILPGEPSRRQKESPSVSQWDGIVGARGMYRLTDKWFIPYSFNAGSGESDFTWGVQTGLGYQYEKLDLLFGWRYLFYDVGSGNAIKELTLNGPFAGALFRW
jgi:hypothetical protein